MCPPGIIPYHVNRVNPFSRRHVAFFHPGDIRNRNRFSPGDHDTRDDSTENSVQHTAVFGVNWLYFGSCRLDTGWFRKSTLDASCLPLMCMYPCSRENDRRAAVRPGVRTLIFRMQKTVNLTTGYLPAMAQVDAAVGGLRRMEYLRLELSATTSLQGTPWSHHKYRDIGGRLCFVYICPSFFIDGSEIGALLITLRRVLSLVFASFFLYLHRRACTMF